MNYDCPYGQVMSYDMLRLTRIAVSLQSSNRRVRPRLVWRNGTLLASPVVHGVTGHFSRKMVIAQVLVMRVVLLLRSTVRKRLWMYLFRPSRLPAIHQEQTLLWPSTARHRNTTATVCMTIRCLKVKRVLSVHLKNRLNNLNVS